jgi:5-methylcytosine-specific restriction endonuclease McrBC GTP-binding regulatory subunit McrB
VGFYNLITKDYQRTRSLDLILSSQENGKERIPYFLILDEMNLSHVERYFADFLSAIESDESIPLHSSKEMIEVPSDIRLGSNISIIGTVNVDETTYMFSPKVLDRANTIEVLSEPISDYMLGTIESYEINGNMRYLENILEDAQEIRSLTIESIRYQFKDVVTTAGNFWQVYTNELEKFHQVLKEAGLDFGFRVVNEISRFILAAWRFEGKPKEWNNWQYYFDMQIKQKMLPKVHGSERSLGRLIDHLFQLCYSEKISKTPREHTFEDLTQKAIYHSAALKLKDMDTTLYSQRYVSFTR